MKQSNAVRSYLSRAAREHSHDDLAYARRAAIRMGFIPMPVRPPLQKVVAVGCTLFEAAARHDQELTGRNRF